MTAQSTANLVLSLALGAMAAGCTVHTYSTRAEYPSAAFMHDEARHDVSYRSDRRSHDRQIARTETDRPSAARPSSYRPENDRPARADIHDRETNQTVRDTKPRTPSGSSATHNVSTAQKPAEGKDKGEHVTLLPAKPEQAKTPRKRHRILSFRERLEKLVEKTDQEVARKEKERSARLRNVIGAAAAEKND